MELQTHSPRATETGTVSATNVTTSVRPPCDTPLVILTTLDDAGQPAGLTSAADATRAFQLLAGRQVPLVLISEQPAEAVLAIQDEAGVRHPFVSGGGSEFHVPCGYFRQVRQLGRRHNGWHIVGFKSPHHASRATRLLVSLYRMCSDEVLVVAIAAGTAGRAVLREADVPIVLRTGTPQEADLLREFPSAYLTDGVGLAGWREAVLGQPV